jgi:hypothetical protein
MKKIKCKIMNHGESLKVNIQGISLFDQQQIAHETAVFRNPHSYYTAALQTRLLSKLYPQKIPSSYIFVKNMTCLHIGLLSMCQVFFLSPVKIVCRWVNDKLLFMSGTFPITLKSKLFLSQYIFKPSQLQFFFWQ